MGGGTWAGTPLPPDQGHPLGPGTPPQDQVPPRPGTPPMDQVHPPPGPQVHPPDQVPPRRYGQQAGSTPPTGMHSCHELSYSL